MVRNLRQQSGKDDAMRGDQRFASFVIKNPSVSIKQSVYQFWRFCFQPN